MKLHTEAAALIGMFSGFAKENKLPAELLQWPDHVAVQAENISDFNQLVKEAEPESERVTVVEDEERFIAVANLVGHLAVPNGNQIKWVEIIEPTKEEAEAGYCIGGHVEYFFADLETASTWFDNRDVVYTVEEWPEVRLRVPYGNFGEELHFGRVPLGEIDRENIISRRAIVVKKAA